MSESNETAGQALPIEDATIKSETPRIASLLKSIGIGDETPDLAEKFFSLFILVGQQERAKRGDPSIEIGIDLARLEEAVKSYAGGQNTLTINVFDNAVVFSVINKAEAEAAIGAALAKQAANEAGAAGTPPEVH